MSQISEFEKWERETKSVDVAASADGDVFETADPDCGVNWCGTVMSMCLGIRDLAVLWDGDVFVWEMASENWLLRGVINYAIGPCGFWIWELGYGMAGLVWWVAHVCACILLLVYIKWLKFDFSVNRNYFFKNRKPNRLTEILEFKTEKTEIKKISVRSVFSVLTELCPALDDPIYCTSTQLNIPNLLATDSWKNSY